MIRLLPFILIPVLILGGLWYWRNSSVQQSLTASQASTAEGEAQAPIEVPKTVPESSTEDRVKSLENIVNKLVTSVNSLKSSSSQTESSGSLDSKLANIESAVTELKARVAVLEKATPAPVSSGSKSPLYIPMSAGGGPWNDQNWLTLNEYQVSINPDSYAGYSGMSLEVNFRLTEAAGTGYIRLYNITDSSAVSSEITTTSTTFGLQASNTFKLPGGQKTYSIQMKSSQNKDMFIQSARIKVNF